MEHAIAEIVDVIFTYKCGHQAQSTHPSLLKLISNFRENQTGEFDFNIVLIHLGQFYVMKK